MFDLFKKQQKQIKVNIDPQKIKEVVERGVEKNYPSDDFLTSKLEKGEQLKIYLGIDPTGPTLHMGHMVVLRKLRQLQQMGHKIILLIGDFTAMIGDPDKASAREPLTREQVMENQKLYKEQASVLLDFEGSNPAEFKYNSEWLKKMNFEDVLNLSSKVTVQQILERDMLKKRFSEGKPIYVHEFMYPLMVAQDSLVMDVDGEVGGNDQTFNMLVGRDLQKKVQDKDKFVIPMKLLVDNSGAKMGKTTGNMLSFSDTADEKFGKIMSWTDGMLELGYELLTDEDLDQVRKRLDSDENPKNIKRDLAFKIIEIFDSKEAAQRAQENWEKQFSKKEIPDNLEELEFEEGAKILDILKETQLVSSNKEGRRKIDEGAVQLSGEKIDDYFFEFKKGEFVLKLGKKMVKIRIV